MINQICLIISFLFLIYNDVSVSAQNEHCIYCPEYVSLTAGEKISLLWDEIEKTKFTQPYPSMAWPTKKMGQLFDISMNTSFDLYSDVLPTNRPRLVHSHGSIAKINYISLISNQDKYTGIYKTGSKHGLIRLSLAGDPSLPFVGVSPGFAIKFLRDKQYSANVIGMYEIAGNGQNYNFFSVHQKNKIKVPFLASSLHIVEKTFQRGAKIADIISVAAPSLYDDHGELYQHPKYPAMIYLVATDDIKNKHFKTSAHDFRDDLAAIEKGTNLFHVYATDEECICGSEPCKDILESKEHCKAELIGLIQTDSPFVPSKFGDETIFFQHSRWEKEPRVTCKYSEVLDAGNRDSTVFSSDLKTDCQRGSDCINRGANLLKSKTVGCPFDAYINSAKKVGASTDESSYVRSH